MAIASLKDLYFDELGDLYDAETQMIRLLPRLAEAARAPELREALKKHCDESRLHLCALGGVRSNLLLDRIQLGHRFEIVFILRSDRPAELIGSDL